MKYFIFIILFILGMLTSVFAEHCPDGFTSKLYLILKSRINNITWLDINEKGDADNYSFHLRYYPCSAFNPQQTEILLSQLIKEEFSGCYLISVGVNFHTEDYCTIKNIKIKCEMDMMHDS